MNAYECVVTSGGESLEAKLALGREGIQSVGGGRLQISYADIFDMRLLNYRILLTLRTGTIEVSQLGYQTEDFFERLWDALNARSRASLFVEGSPLMCSEGDYSYFEPDAKPHGIAKLEVFDACVCLYPHDIGARRVPLCFADECVREGFSLTLALDTGERYRIARLGRDTNPFFDRVEASRERTRAKWKNAHAALEHELDARLGDARERYAVLESGASKVEVGLFSSDSEWFWMVAVQAGRAVVEMVTNEDTAAYLYEFEGAAQEFVRSLRHAMEATQLNRRIVFATEDEVERTPLYRMSVDRNAHVRFLRGCNVGRIIHTSGWEDRVRAFLRS